jgi:hypothetical protein
MRRVALKVYVCLLRHCDGDGAATLSLSELRGYTGLSRGGVRRQLKELCGLGYLRQSRAGGASEVGGYTVLELPSPSEHARRGARDVPGASAAPGAQLGPDTRPAPDAFHAKAAVNTAGAAPGDPRSKRRAGRRARARPADQGTAPAKKLALRAGTRTDRVTGGSVTTIGRRGAAPRADAERTEADFPQGGLF